MIYTNNTHTVHTQYYHKLHNNFTHCEKHIVPHTPVHSTRLPLCICLVEGGNHWVLCNIPASLMLRLCTLVGSVGHSLYSCTPTTGSSPRRWPLQAGRPYCTILYHECHYRQGGWQAKQGGSKDHPVRLSTHPSSMPHRTEMHSKALYLIWIGIRVPLLIAI